MPNYREDLLEEMRLLIAASFPRAIEGKMFGSVAWFTDDEGGKKGKLFCSVFEEGVTFKLPRERVAELLNEGTHLAFEPYGMPPMREWLYVVHDDPQDYHAELGLLREACEFVQAQAAAKEKG